MLRAGRGWQVFASQRPWCEPDDMCTVPTGYANPDASAGRVPLGLRFPAAHQFLRHRLIDEVYPIAPWVACDAVEEGPDSWRVSLRWPELDFDSTELFTGEELRVVFGRWSSWARARALDIADLLPV